jgi:hypothetical protein
VNPETAATVVNAIANGEVVRLAYCPACSVLSVSLDRFQERCGKCHSPFPLASPSVFVRRSTMSGPTRIDDGGMDS